MTPSSADDQIRNVDTRDLDEEDGCSQPAEDVRVSGEAVLAYSCKRG